MESVHVVASRGQALGIAGGGVFLALRARTLGAGRVEIRELAVDSMTGHMAAIR